MTGMVAAELVKITLVLAITLGLAATARRRSAALRHLILMTGLVAGLLLPVLSGLWPASLAATLTPVRSTEPASPPSPAAGRSAVAPEDVTTSVPVRAKAAAPSPSARTLTGTRAAAVAWATGALLALSRLVWGLVTLRRLARGAVPITHGPWRAACDAAAECAGVVRPVQLRRGARNAPIVTWGWRRPAILLPDEALAWPADRRAIVLAHELAHIARGDWAAQLVGETVRALHWYHPLAWMANQRLRVEGERAADDRVVAAGVDGADYATHLLALAADTRAQTPWTPAPAIARQSSLEGRITAMLDATIDRRPVSRRHQLRVATLALAGVLPLAALSVAQTPFHTLSGTLVDPSGRVLPNVSVSLTNAATAARYEVRSDATGRYEFVGLTPASYALEAKAPGFETRAVPVSLTADRDLPLRLAVGTLHETITVATASDVPSDPVAETERHSREQARAARASERQARATAACAANTPSPVGGNILPPIKIRHVPPAYPEQARAAGLGGTVRMQAVIDSTGAVAEIRDVEGPSAELEAAATEAVREWRFTPTLLNCEAIDVLMQVKVDFAARR